MFKAYIKCNCNIKYLNINHHSLVLTSKQISLGHSHNSIISLCHYLNSRVVIDKMTFLFNGWQWCISAPIQGQHNNYTMYFKNVLICLGTGMCMWTDGASINRKFAGMLFPHPETPRSSDFVFSDISIFFSQHKIVYIQDMMHCLKKIRSNIERSKLQHKTKAGIYLLLENNCIVW